jgi:hypothetical protein
MSLQDDEIERLKQLLQWQNFDRDKMRQLMTENHDLQAAVRRLWSRARTFERANEALLKSMSRCCDVIQKLRDNVIDRELANEASIYLNIIESTIGGKPIEPNAPINSQSALSQHYETIRKMREYYQEKNDGMAED